MSEQLPSPAVCGRAAPFPQFRPGDNQGVRTWPGFFMPDGELKKIPAQVQQPVSLGAQIRIIR